MSDVPINHSGKVHGWNFTTKPDHGYEADFWIEWDWDGWVRLQTDYAMSMGANAISMVGDVAMVTGHSPAGTLSQDTYNRRWQQLAAYCADNGLALYYKGCATFPFEPNNVGQNGTNASYAASHANFCAVMQRNIDWLCGGCGTDYTSIIIGADLVTEASVDFASKTPTDIGIVYEGVSTPSSIGKTFGCGEMISNPWVANNIAYLDYIDYHVYADYGYGINGHPTPTDFTNGPRSSFPTKDIILGEGGASNKYVVADINAFHLARNVIYNMADSHMRGGLTWAVQDGHATDPARQWGAFFHGTWEPLSTRRILATVKGLGGSSLNAPTNMKVRGGALIWDLNGCSDDFASTRLYQDGTVVADQSYARYVLPRDGVQHTYQATAVKTGGTESAKSAAFVWTQPRPVTTFNRWA